MDDRYNVIEKVTEVKCVPYQLCPKCQGFGWVMSNLGYGTVTHNTCDVCHGDKIIPQCVTDSPQPLSGVTEVRSNTFSGNNVFMNTGVTGQGGISPVTVPGLTDKSNYKPVEYDRGAKFFPSLQIKKVFSKSISSFDAAGYKVQTTSYPEVNWHMSMEDGRK